MKFTFVGYSFIGAQRLSAFTGSLHGSRVAGQKWYKDKDKVLKETELYEFCSSKDGLGQVELLAVPLKMYFIKHRLQSGLLKG